MAPLQRGNVIFAFTRNDRPSRSDAPAIGWILQGLRRLRAGRGLFESRVRATGDETLKNHGFTLVELMVVTAIVITLAAIAIPSYSRYIDKARITSTVNEIRSIEKAITAYYIVSARYPATLAVIGLGDLRDKWGNPYEYLPVAGAKVGKLRKDRFLHPVNTDYDLYSKGKDGKSTTPFTAAISQDDIVRANNGEYVGLVSEY